MGYQYGYIPGGSWGCCPRCGFDRRLNDMRYEWTGLKVCQECWDPRPAELTAPNIYPEGQVRPDAQPTPTPIFVEDIGGVSREDL